MENIIHVKYWHGKWEARSAMKRNVASANANDPRDRWHAKWDAYVVEAFKANGGKNFKAFDQLHRQIGLLSANRVMPEIGRAYVDRSIKDWKPCVWDDESWFYNAPTRILHAVHVSHDDPAQVAYTPSEAYLLRDRQTRVKPGRYLAQFFGPGSENPVLTEAEVKYWADRQVAASKPVELRFIANDDPDGWEWVYENGPMSCMRYNRDDRYLASGLYGEDHPVRIYAHPDNDLALAFIMVPGKAYDRDLEAEYYEELIAARTIVNTEAKTYHRVYGANDNDTYRSALRAALELAGYQHSDHVLEGQKLRIHKYNGSLVCPYLDGEYSNVEVHSYYLVVGRYGMDGQNSCGLLEDNRCQCDCCDGYFDEDDLTCVEWKDQRVCQDCLDINYTYAYTGRYQEWVPDSESLYRYKGDTYTGESLDYHDLRICDDCDEVMSLDDMVELHDNSYVCRDHTELCEVTDEWYLSSDLSDTEFDGRIAQREAVELFPSGEYGWKDRCYRLTTTGDKFLWVHQDFMEGMDSDEFTAFFGVFAQALVPFSMQGEYVGFIERITEAFTPLNVRDGDDVYSTIEDMIESHIPEVDDEIVLINKETENERIAA